MPPSRPNGPPVAATVTRVLAAVLPVGLPLTPDTPLAALGLESLTSVRFWLELQREFDAELPASWLGDCASLGELADRVATALAAAGPGGGEAGLGAGLDQAGLDQAGLGQAGLGQAGGDPGERFEPFPLTPLQEAYVVAKQPDLTTDAAGCHIYREFELGAPDPDRLRLAWQRLVDHHDMLRVIMPDGMQRILPQAPPWTMPVHDLASAPAETVAAHLAAVRGRLSHRCYRQGEWPLFAIEVTVLPAGHATVHLSLDTVITDGHGLALLMEQWQLCYADPGYVLPDSPRTVRDYLMSLHALRGSPRHQRDLAYWRERLDGLPPGPPLAEAGAPPAGLPVHLRTPLGGSVGTSGWRVLRDRAAELRITPTALILTVFARVLAEHWAPQPFSVTLTANDRAWLPPQARHVVGPFTSTIVFPVSQPVHGPLAEAAHEVHEQLWQDLTRACVSGVEALREIGGRGRSGGNAVLPVVFTSMLDAGAAAGLGAGFGERITYAVSQTSGVALDHQMWEQDGELRYRWDVAEALLPPGAAQVLFAAFANALECLAVHPSAALTRQATGLQLAYIVSRAAGDPDQAQACTCYHTFAVADLDLARLESAWLRLVTGTEVLRTAIGHDGSLQVYPRPPARWRIPVIDLRADPDAGQVMDAIRAEMTGRAFPLGWWPHADLRVTVDEAGWTVHLGFDVAVADGRSIELLFRELFRLYADPGAVPPPGRAGAGEPAASGPAEEEEYWRIAALPPGPPVGPGPAESVSGGKTRFETVLGGRYRLARRARTCGVSSDALILAVFTDALAAVFPDPFALPVVCWPAEAEQHRPGEFSALTWVAGMDPRLPLPVKAAAYQQHIDLASAASLTEVRRRVMRERRTRSFAFPVVYTCIMDLTGHPLPAGVTAGTWLTSTPDVSLDCICSAEDDELRCYWDAVADDFPDGLLAQAFQRFREGMERLTGDGRWQAGAADTPEAVPEGAAGQPVQALFEDHARRQPDAVAVRWRQGSMSFGELNTAANRIAWLLRDLGAGPEKVVAIRARRGPEMVAAVYGILKAGAAYLPVDPSLPAARAARMLELTSAQILLTTSDTPAADTLGGRPPVRVIELDREPRLADPGCPGTDPPPVSTAANTAYVIFTSGSTGTPKGVAVTHRSVVNMLTWTGTTFGLGPGDLGLAVTPLAFDLSVFDVLGLPGLGAAIYIADDEQRTDPELLLDVLLEVPVTFWNSAPGTFGQLVPLLERRASGPQARLLRLVIVGGDFIPLALPGQIRAAFPAAEVIGIGGPTETTVWSNYYRIDEVDPQWRSIPYGRPIAGTREYILDPGLRPCPPGVEGDLYTAGTCLAGGFWNLPGLTAERFVADPFAVTPGERMYRTGDRAAWLPDGDMCILGRSDDQVKVRGFRVEPKEIEHRLRQHPGVRDAVVVARSGPAGDAMLAGYVIPAVRPAPATAELRRHAAAALPDYMVPNAITFLDAFPLTGRGKLDRSALPWPQDQPAAPPAGGLRAEITALFSELLGTAVDPEQDLWDQGASSFTMVRVSAALKQRHGRRVPVSALVAEPTVAGIARYLSAGAQPGGESQVEAEPPRDAEPTAATGPEPVDILSAQEKEAFLAARWNIRPAAPGERVITLPEIPLAPEHYLWRASQRSFLDTPVPAASFARFLSLLREVTVEGRRRLLYPSAGDTYAIQAYLSVRAGAIEGLAEGSYYYHPVEHALHRLGDQPGPGRSAHFYYNRPVFDRAGFGLFLIGQARGIEPLYQEQTDRFLLVGAGYIGQLLMMGQAACDIGLCPIGTVAEDQVREEFRLDGGHRLLHSFLGGHVRHPSRASGGDRPVFAPAGAGPVQARPGSGGDVAVIGMAGRFPAADNPGELWRNLLAGSTALGPLPAGRRQAIPAAPPGGYLADIESFDSLLFRIAPGEAETLDPQLRLLLEAVWEAVENAGHTPASLRRAGRVGVFAGVMWQDFQHVGAGEFAALPSDIPNRISHVFGFDGPSLAVNTSCSSSLSALHLATQSLRLGECSVAVVAAVNVIAHPYHLQLLRGRDLLAPDGVAGAFDGAVAGWSPGEGAAAVLLRPAATARTDGDVIHCVVEGTSTGHAGGTARFGTPDSASLAASMTAALRAAGVTPADVGYVECAAAGASLSDAAEIEAIAQVLGPDRPPIPAGTLKPNIGHLEAASGLSQLIKVIMQLQARRIAPTRLAGNVSPLVALDEAGLRVPVTDEPWEPAAPGKPLRALINSVGATGSHAHAVLRSADPAQPPVPPPAPGPQEQLILLSAPNRDKLGRAAARLAGHVTATGPDRLRDIAWTLQTGRVAMRHRLALTCSDLAGLRDGLAAAADGLSHDGLRIAGTGPARKAADAELTADQAVTAWLGGHDVAWERYWVRPGRRIPLPGYLFARRRKPAAVTAPAAADRARKDQDYPERAVLERYVMDVFAEVSGIDVAELDAHVPLADYGLSSFLVLGLNARLAADFTEPVSKTLFYEHRDLAEVAAGLRHRTDGPWPPAGPIPAAGRAGPSPRRTPPGTWPVAIVGIAGRYPQAADLDQFWQNLAEGRDCVGQLPPERRQPGWPAEQMWGGFLADVDKFDPLLFSISPRDAALMDPQERLFLEVGWETLEDAGYPQNRLAERFGGRVGVFAGSMYNEYPFLAVEQSLDGHAADAGSALGGIANRVSHTFDLRGPSLTVDTMCSSSLTAIHLAIESLRRGECDAALAGGVNLSLHPHKFRQQARLKMTAAGHRCRSFGAEGDGLVPGEGVGAVLLRPLDAAIADGDRIHAVILGSAVSHDGRTNGYLVPNPVAQADMIAEALRRAQVSPASISYVEAHGTGTQLGDPVEINGLTRAYGQRPAGSCPIGSVKSGIGHLEGAAGIAGLTKVVLQLRHRRLAPSLHAERLNPNINWDRCPFRVQRTAADWPARAGADGATLPRRAAVSSFGAGGSNAHLVLEEYQPVPGPDGTGRPAGSQLVVLSAHDQERLRLLAGRLAAHLAGPAAGTGPDRLADVAYTLQVGREPLRQRLAFVVTDADQLSEQLTRFGQGTPAGLAGRAPAGAPSGPPQPEEGTAAPDLPALARHWVSGGAVAWDRLHRTAPRPRLVKLPGYPFAQISCWLPRPAATASGPAPAAATGIQVYRKTWVQARAVARTADPDGDIVCVCTDRTLPVAARLAGPLGRVIVVKEGQPAAGEPGLAFSDDRDATAVAAELLRRHPGIVGLIDLVDLHADGHVVPTARAALVQELLRRRPAGRLRLMHVTSGLASCPGPPPAVAGAWMAGLVRVIGAEYQRVHATSLDTGAPAVDPAAAVADIVAEWPAADRIAEVCYRAGLRYTPELTDVTLPAVAGPPLNPDLVYLVTGGTRGIGALAAGHLADLGAGKLALLRSTPLPPPAEWADPGLPAADAEAVRHISDLRRRGVQVLAGGGSLSDRSWLGEFLAEVRASLGPIGGVLHCAGRPSQGRPAFVHKDADTLREVAGPKVDGLTALAAECASDPLAFFVLFSSVAAVIPRLGSGVSDYAAANAFLDAYASYQVRSGHPEFRSIAWPTWREAGMGRDRPDACSGSGLDSIGNADGLRLLGSLIAPTAAQVPASVLVCPPLPGRLDPRQLLSPAGPEPAQSGAEPAAAVQADPVPGDPVPGWLSALFAGALGIPEPDLDPTAPFGDLGVESVMLAELVHLIETRLGRSIEPSLLLEHDTLARLGQHVTRSGWEPPTAGIARPAARPRAETAPVPGPHAETAAPARAGARAARPIAVIGMACRFPGAPDLGTFWRNLMAGHCAITEVPRSRWDTGELYRPGYEPGKSISRWGGFVSDLEDFDPDYFGLTEEEATCLDPSVRMMLEGAAACLHEAGYAPAGLRGADVGVFAGGRLSGYRHRRGIRVGPAAFGADQGFIAARVADHFDLRGPALVVDSACSSALVAVRLAVNAMLAGDCELALVAGVDVLLDEGPYLELSANRALSPSGRCFAFDERADGLVPGEGCGVLLLKPLDLARHDGDRVHAVIAGVAVNNDGHTMGFTTPNPDVQAAVVRRALAAAGLRADDIGLVEAHGTGTMIGDPIELRALTGVFRESTDRLGRCAIGSVKTNIGHLMSAAGMAGLIKVALAVEHGELPATLNCDRPNPRFDFAASPFFLSLESRPWAGQRRRAAGVSAFGFGGTNAHAIVVQADPGDAAGRPPLPAPVFRRQRLWLDRSPAQPRPEPAAPVVSITELEFAGPAVTRPVPSGSSL